MNEMANSISTDDSDEDPRLLTTKSLVEQNKRKLKEIEEDELKFRLGVEKYLTVPPREYFEVLNELYYQRRITQIEQQKLQLEYEKRKLDLEKKRLVKLSKSKAAIQAQNGWKTCVRGLKSCWKSKRLRKYLGLRLLQTCGFFSESFVSTSYSVACLILIFVGIIGICSSRFECLELQIMFSKDKSLEPIRYLSLSGFTCLLVAALHGYAAEIWNIMRPIGLILWIIGWPLIVASYCLEYQIAYGEELRNKMNLEVQSYMNNPGRSLQPFMDDIQEGFECCGTYGPEGYGYRHHAHINSPVVFPPSCCRRSSRLKGESKVCVFYGLKLQNDSSVSSSYLDTSINRNGCLKLAQEYFQDLHQNKFLIQWVSVIAFVMSILTMMCFLKIWIKKRRLYSQYPFLHPHQTRRLSNIDEVIQIIKLKTSVKTNGITPTRSVRKPERA